MRANSDVCRRDKVHAATDAGAVHGRYDGLPAPLQVRDARLPVPAVGEDGLGLLGDVAVAAKAAEGRELCEVDAGGEYLAVPGQDDRAAVLVVGQQPEGLSNLSVMKIYIFSFWKITWGQSHMMSKFF